MKGYKAFDKNMMCREFQYKTGEIYKLEGELKLYDNGFHFCEKFLDCLKYYTPESRFCEVRAGKNTISGDNKIVTDEITIIRELVGEELRKLLTGEDKGWHKNGQPEYQRFYKDGKQDGEWKGWYENGQPEYHQFYKDRKQEGKQKGWRENGQLWYQEFYKDGKLEGEQKGWWENGQLEYQTFYKDGNLEGEQKEWLGCGQLWSHEYYNDGMREEDGIFGE